MGDHLQRSDPDCAGGAVFAQGLIAILDTLARQQHYRGREDLTPVTGN